MSQSFTCNWSTVCWTFKYIGSVSSLLYPLEGQSMGMGEGMWGTTSSCRCARRCTCSRSWYMFCRSLCYDRCSALLSPPTYLQRFLCPLCQCFSWVRSGVHTLLPIIAFCESLEGFLGLRLLPVAQFIICTEGHSTINRVPEIAKQVPLCLLLSLKAGSTVCSAEK